MENREAIYKLEFMRNAYQKLIDEKVDSGRLVGTDVTGTWKAETPLNDAYQEHIDALTLAIAAIKKLEAIKNNEPPTSDWEVYSNRLYEQAYERGYRDGKEDAEDAENDRWRPFHCRKTTEDDCSSFDYIMDCELPEDGQEILITVNNNRHEPVQMDTFFGGGGEECALDSGYDLCDEAIAWRPLPEPYQEEKA